MKQFYPLRPHHSLCITFFRGKGYSEAFVQNMTEQIRLLRQEDAGVVLTEHGDIICAACPHHCQGYCQNEEKVSCFDRACLKSMGLSEGDRLPFSQLSELAKEKLLLPGKLPMICGSCQWFSICQPLSKKIK